MINDVSPDRSVPERQPVMSTATAAEAKIATAAAAELERLYDELSTATAETVVALKLATAAPTWTTLAKFRNCAARVNKISDRINAVLR
jgi:hypothetical protein